MGIFFCVTFCFCNVGHCDVEKLILCIDRFTNSFEYDAAKGERICLEVKKKKKIDILIIILNNYRVTLRLKERDLPICNSDNPGTSYVGNEGKKSLDCDSRKLESYVVDEKTRSCDYSCEKFQGNLIVDEEKKQWSL